MRATVYLSEQDMRDAVLAYIRSKGMYGHSLITLNLWATGDHAGPDHVAHAIVETSDRPLGGPKREPFGDALLRIKREFERSVTGVVTLPQIGATFEPLEVDVPSIPFPLADGMTDPPPPAAGGS